MDGAEIVSDGLSRINRILHRALEGVPVDVLNRLPVPHANSMSWLAWHLTRVQAKGIGMYLHAVSMSEFNQIADDDIAPGGITIDNQAFLGTETIGVAGDGLHAFGVEHPAISLVVANELDQVQFDARGRENFVMNYLQFFEAECLHENLVCFRSISIGLQHLDESSAEVFAGSAMKRR